MRIVAHIVRKALFDALSGNITYSGSVVPVFNHVPKGTSYPFIRIYGEDEKQDHQNQTSFISQTLTKIEVVTRFRGKAGGELQAQQILDLILQAVRANVSSKLSTDSFNNYVTEIPTITYLTDYGKDHTYYRAIAEISTQTQQV